MANSKTITTSIAKYLPNLWVCELRDACERLPSRIKIEGIYTQFNIRELVDEWGVSFSLPIWQNGMAWVLPNAPLKMLMIAKPPIDKQHRFEVRHEWAKEIASILQDKAEPNIWMDSVPWENPLWWAVRFPVY